MKPKVEFWDVLLRGGKLSAKMMVAFFFGLLAIGVLGNLAYDLLAGMDNPASTLIKVLVAVLVLIGGAYVLYERDQRKIAGVGANIDESRLAPPHEGLVWLFGPGPTDHLLSAIQHHQQGGRGSHCWLIMQDSAVVREAFSRLPQRLLDEGISTRLHTIYIENLNVADTYLAARSVVEREAEEEGVPASQVILDITGGTKPMTAGMFLASLTRGSAVEYVESERGADGSPIPGTLRVVLLDADFYPDEAR